MVLCRRLQTLQRPSGELAGWLPLLSAQSADYHQMRCLETLAQLADRGSRSSGKALMRTYSLGHVGHC